EAFRQLYNRPPSDIRRRGGHVDSPAELSILLPYRPPYDWEAMFRFFRDRAIEGVEVVTDDAYQRVIQFDGSIGTLCVAHAAEQSSLRVTIGIGNLKYVPQIITRLRRQFDLAADPHTIAEVLARDELLAPLVQVRPG